MKNYPSLISFILDAVNQFKTKIILTALISILMSLYPSANAYIIKLIINTAAEWDSQNNISIILEVKNYILTYAAIYLSLNLGWTIIDTIDMYIYPQLKARIINLMFSRLIKQDLQFFHDRLTGAIASKISEMTNSINNLFVTVIDIVFWQLSMFMAAGFTIYYVHPVVSVVFTIWILAFMLMNWFFSKKIIALSADLTNKHAFAAGKISDSFNNILNIKIFSASQYELDNTNKALNKMIQAHQLLYKYQRLLTLVQGLSVTSMNIIIITLLLYYYEHRQVTLGDFALVTKLSTDILNRIWRFTAEFNKIIEYYGSIKECYKLLAEPINILDKPNNIEIVPKNFNIEFKNVTFAYNLERTVFYNLSVNIKANSKVGLVGYSGSGKTSFVNLINRFYEVNQGQIIIGEYDIADFSQDTLHQFISYNPQEPILFHRTIYENIQYGNRSASYEEVIAAAKKAHAHEFIMQTPNGYNSLVGERGVKLSGGQRQRIAIARAFLKNAPILILDEATSALDSTTEKYIQNSLEELIENKTLIVVAHRLSTLLKMERILVFDKGKIIEDGSHQELLSKGGLYKELWDKQSMGFLPASKDEV